MMTRQAASTHLHSPRAPATAKDVDRLCIDTIRTLAIDAVQKAQSGHAGTPMGVAPVAYTLWQEFLRYDPADPLWANRDRFVLSCGHASMLLYALLHLAGVRRSDGRASPTPPRSASTTSKTFAELEQRDARPRLYGRTTGVEATTGRLGQGCGKASTMAIASRWLGARYNRLHFPIFDFDVYTICSDGDLMEGVASEATSLAGHLGLANLCWIYDSNTVTIGGHTDLAFSEDVESRFRGYRWNVPRLRDANDTAALARALQAFRRADDRPTIMVSTASSVTARRINRIPRPLTATRSAKRSAANQALPQDTRNFSPTACRSVPRSHGRGRALRDDWMRTFALPQRTSASGARNRNAVGRRSFRPTGTPARRNSRPTQQAWRRGKPRARFSIRSPKTFPG